MQVQATVFSRLLQQLPWAAFDRAVTEHRMDEGHRGLDARSHLVALVAAQLLEVNGLRDVEAALASHAPSLKRRRIKPACRSTLSDANRYRPAAAFEAMVPALLQQMSPTQARRTRDDLRLVDSTLILPGRGAERWANFQDGNIAAKVHVVYDPKAELPTFYEVSSGNTNDISVAKSKMPVEAGATYIFDLGYYDYGFWAELDAQGCRFVTRLKKNTRVTLVEERTVADGSNVVADRIVELPERMARSRRNPFRKRGRLVTVTLDTGKRLRLFTNDLESPAAEISDLYRTRWQIELFFRWIKQNLKIRHFLGRSQNAVRLQIAAAIVTYILLKLLHRASRTTKTVAQFARSVQHSLFHRIDLDTLVGRIERTIRPDKDVQPPQLELALP